MTAPPAVICMLVSGCAVSPMSAQSPATPLPKPLDLLDRAYQSSRYQSFQERTYTLLLLARSAEPLSKNKARDWAVELFDVAQKAGTRDAGSFQKNPLVILSRIDSSAAAELFRQQILPKREPGVEDPRPYGAEALFPALYETRGSKG